MAPNLLETQNQKIGDRDMERRDSFLAKVLASGNILSIFRV